ncbi:MAG: 30S ribosomal protein S3 [Chlamydiae bacterium]|nr:MAG: 30S ribosomal protein S3 [Chlamydiota bacterium]
MGQKTSPIGFRLIRNKRWRSLWYANKQEFGDLLGEDAKIRKHLMKKSCCVGTSRIIIRRMSGKIEVTIHTARPGLVIGRKAAELDILKQELRKLTGKEIWIEVEEIKRPDLEAQLVAENIARQLERRIPFRRIMKKAMQATMDAGAIGIKVQISGRIGGAEIARVEWYILGSVPLHTLRADIDYATTRAETTYGSIGIKVCINKGEDEINRSKLVGG